MNKFIRNLRCNGDCELVYLRPFYNLDRDNIHYVNDYDEDKIGVNVFALYEENQSLKKQLEKKYNKTGTLTNEVLYEENTKLINQQKEFIEYLENNIKQYEDKVEKCQFMAGMLTLPISFWKDELKKYKEIIGCKDEQ